MNERPLGLLVVGTNHRTSPVELRESLVFDPELVKEALRAARGDGVVQEAMILSTCNRTELYALGREHERSEEYLRNLVARFKGRDLLSPGPHIYRYREREMAGHLLRVAASLDSMVLGEVQILGQVKDAYSLAVEGGTAGAVLNRLLPAAFRAGKRARTETEIGAGAVSIASAATALTSKIMSDLSQKRLLLVGAGETGRLAAQHLAAHHPLSILVANRTPARAEALAAELEGQAITLDEVPARLHSVDVVVCATRSPEVLVTAPMVREAMKRRGSSPMVIVDIAVPRNVDPAVARIENVFAYSIDALQNLVDQNLARRKRDVPRVEAIVNEELEAFLRWASSLAVAPVVRALRKRFEDVRQEELRKSLSQFSETERKKVEEVTRALVNKLLHTPTVAIRSADPGTQEGALKLDAACRLFDLQPDEVDEP